MVRLFTLDNIFESTYSFVVASLFATGLPKLTIRLLFAKIFVEAANSVLLSKSVNANPCEFLNTIPSKSSP